MITKNSGLPKFASLVARTSLGPICYQCLSQYHHPHPVAGTYIHLYSSYTQTSYTSLTSSPSLSRPDPGLSDYSLFAPRIQAPMTKHGYTTSCPTTPLSYRRYPTTTQHSPTPPSPYRSNNITIPPQPSNKLGLYQTLYRPDLTKLSSLRQGRRWNDSYKKSLSHSSVNFRGDNSIDLDE